LVGIQKVFIALVVRTLRLFFAKTKAGKVF